MTAKEPGAIRTTVYQAWATVMAEVEALGKNQRNTEGGNYSYRGIDDLMNIVGPVLRRHQVMVIPRVLETSYRDVRTSRDKPAREVTVKVEFTIYGPDGDSIVGATAGESMDFGDKGTAKAFSVAYRIFLLQALTLPTDERDPDSQTYERSSGKTPEQNAQETADRTATATDPNVLQNVKQWAAGLSLLDINVNDADGNSRSLLSVIDDRLELLVRESPEAQADKQARVDRALGASEEPSVDHTDD